MSSFVMFSLRQGVWKVSPHLVGMLLFADEQALCGHLQAKLPEGHVGVSMPWTIVHYTWAK